GRRRSMRPDLMRAPCWSDGKSFVTKDTKKAHEGHEGKDHRSIFASFVCFVFQSLRLSPREGGFTRRRDGTGTRFGPSARATTRLRPFAFASYSARSATAISRSGGWSARGRSAA